MSINEEPQLELSSYNHHRPFDGADPAYTVEEYLNSIVAGMIFSSGIEPGHDTYTTRTSSEMVFYLTK